MREETEKLVKVLEEKELKFELAEADGERDFDSIYLTFAGDFKDYEIRISIDDGFYSIGSRVINAVKKEKYESLLEVLNDVNYNYRFARFFAMKDDEDESYGVIAAIESIYEDNYDPEATLSSVDVFLSVIDEAYPEIVKAIG